jgi:hypothetical protein
MAVKARPPAGSPLCAICAKEMVLVKSKPNPSPFFSSIDLRVHRLRDNAKTSGRTLSAAAGFILFGRYRFGADPTRGVPGCLNIRRSPARLRRHSA